MISRRVFLKIIPFLQVIQPRALHAANHDQPAFQAEEKQQCVAIQLPDMYVCVTLSLLSFRYLLLHCL